MSAPLPHLKFMLPLWLRFESSRRERNMFLASSGISKGNAIVHPSAKPK